MITPMQVYLAGPLFSPAERAFLAECARAYRDAGIDCFVPHEHELARAGVTAADIFAIDCRGLEQSHALVAWLDGPTVDDGTACEIGVYYGLMARGDAWRKGILGLSTDLRRSRDGRPHGGLNLFVAGLIERAGRLCWSVDEVRQQLLAWQRELTG
jgi:hypothetical protein